MFGIDYLTVGGYAIDGDIVCRGCGEKRGLPSSDSLTVNELDNAFPEGLNCGDCGEEIVEAPEEPEADDEEEEEETDGDL